MENNLKDKSFALALQIVKMCKYLKETRKEYSLSQELLTHGTQIGAIMVRVAYEDDKEEIAKNLSNALKEAQATDYWIELIYLSKLLNEENYNNIKNEIKEVSDGIERNIKLLNADFDLDTPTLYKAKTQVK